MRGKGIAQQLYPQSARITPAYAGKRQAESCKQLFEEDHPRLCGEKSTCPRLADNKKGSPPPMRGKVFRRVCPVVSTGITPAYAGKRAVSCISLALTWDHPRLCGEKRSYDTPHDSSRGSPPPMRGKGIMQQPKTADNRITPAYAGKRLTPIPCKSV